MPKRPAAALVVCLLAPLHAQPAPVRDPAQLLRPDNQQRAAWAEEWLRSADPRRVAWGAWLARTDRLTGLLPLLLQKVAAYGTEQSSGHDAMLAVLDALIEMRAGVPVDDAHKLYPEFVAQSVILLVRSPDDARDALLDIFDRAGANWTWLAVGNVLLKKEPGVLAARLLGRFTGHLMVSVYDPGKGGGSGGGVSECAFSTGEPKDGWPPVGLYRLTQFPDRIPGLIDVFLVDGPTPVYYWRAESRSDDNPSDSPTSCGDGDRDRYRAQYSGATARSPRSVSGIGSPVGG